MNECSNGIRFCRARMCPCDHEGDEKSCPMFSADCRAARGNVPTVGMVKAMYAEMHRSMTDHETAVMTEMRRFQRTTGISDDDLVDRIGYDSMEKYVSSLRIRNVSKIDACYRIQCMLGRRERAFYRKHGYDVRPVDIPIVEDDTAAYRSKSPEDVMKILSWYRQLQFDRDGRKRIYAMFMLKYAMRNGDVRRLRWSNFNVSGSRWQLEYVPHKTERATAGRSVKIWMNPSDQVELEEWRKLHPGEDFVLPRKIGRMCLRGLERSMNASLRKSGFRGSKGMYELRKMCIDTVYHLNGAEAASAYSGDDFKTVKFHYADTSSMNLKGIGDGEFGA